MDNFGKIILILATIVIVVIIVTLSFGQMNKSTERFTEAEEEMDVTLDSMSEASILMYDSRVVSASEARLFYNKYSNKITITVGSTAITDLGTQFVSRKDYKCTLSFNTSGHVISADFVQQ